MLNVADVAAYVGLAMLVRTAWMVAREIRAKARTGDADVLDSRVERELESALARVGSFADRQVEREVTRPVHRDGVPADAAWVVESRAIPAAVREAEVIPIDVPRNLRHVYLEADRARLDFPRPMSHRQIAD